MTDDEIFEYIKKTYVEGLDNKPTFSKEMISEIDKEIEKMRKEMNEYYSNKKMDKD